MPSPFEQPSHTNPLGITDSARRSLNLQARHTPTLLDQHTLVDIPEALKRWLASSYSQYMTDPIAYPSQSLELYSRAIPVEERVRAIFERTGEPVQILDVGCGDGKALLEIQQRFGERVSIYGLSLCSIPMIPAERSVCMPVELLPDTYRGRFELILCRHALNMFLCPPIALRAMAYCLTRGGEA